MMYNTLELTTVGERNYKYDSRLWAWEIKPEGVHLMSKPKSMVTRFYPVYTLIECSFETHEK